MLFISLQGMVVSAFAMGNTIDGELAQRMNKVIIVVDADRIMATHEALSEVRMKWVFMQCWSYSMLVFFFSLFDTNMHACIVDPSCPHLRRVRPQSRHAPAALPSRRQLHHHRPS